LRCFAARDRRAPSQCFDGQREPRSQAAHSGAADTGQRICRTVAPRRTSISMTAGAAVAAITGAVSSLTLTGTKLALAALTGRLGDVPQSVERVS